MALDNQRFRAWVSSLGVLPTDIQADDLIYVLRGATSYKLDPTTKLLLQSDNLASLDDTDAARANLGNKLDGTTDPAVSNDDTEGYGVGSIWVNTTASPRKAFVCTDASTGAAVWAPIPVSSALLAANDLSDLNDTDTAIANLISGASASSLQDWVDAGVEYGTFTPTLGRNVTNPTVSYDEQEGIYAKIGRFIIGQAYIEASSISGGSGSLLTLDGLPEAAEALSASGYQGPYAVNQTLFTNNVAFAVADGDSMRFMELYSTSTTGNSFESGGGILRVFFMYRVAA